MTAESKKLQTMMGEAINPDAPHTLYSIAISGDPEEGLLERAQDKELEHDARIAHEQREVIRKLVERLAIIEEATCGTPGENGTFDGCLQVEHAALVAIEALLESATPFLEA